MCSELLRIPITWHGVPIFGFGVAVLAWLAVSGWIMRSTARQSDWKTALGAHAPTVLIVAALIVFGVPRMMPGGVPIRSYGLLMLLGVALGIAISIRRGLEGGLALDDMLGLCLWMIPGGAIGGLLFYVIEYWNDRIREPTLWGTLKNALAFTEGGLVVYGAFIGVMAAFVLYVRRYKLPALALADLAAPALLIGLAFGRVGCLMNGCCYGGETNLPWAITFPRQNSPTTPSPPYADQAGAGRFHGFRLADKPSDGGGVVVEHVDAGSLAAAAGLRDGDRITAINGKSVASADEAHVQLFGALRDAKSLALTTPDGVRNLEPLAAPPRSLPVHPTQVYSAIDAGLLAWVLWSYYPFRRRDGEVMALMVILHPISRFLLEDIRVDESAVWGTGLSISQNLSVAFLASGVAMWLWLQRKPVNQLALPLAA
jgi:phosphatidylglycerol:prolipoprotein diacylglycerol transferase